MGDPAAGKAITGITAEQQLSRVKLKIAGNRCIENTSGLMIARVSFAAFRPSNLRDLVVQNSWPGA